ncbi:hypothetical protein FO519_001141 [Halicephalobus sp. NKZ332]|nr:hypothetical protein FO519_001141 [Halicephalobus sp. NKZ332]
MEDSNEVETPLIKQFFKGAANKKEQEPPVKKVSLGQLWRYSSSFDLLLIFIGSLVAIVTGMGMPLLSIIMGGMGQAFVNATTLLDPSVSSNETAYSNYSLDKFSDDMEDQILYSVYLGAGLFASAFVQVTCFLIASENLMHRMRKEFFKAILRQDISWYDANHSGTLTSKLFDNLERVKEGTGDKVALAVQFLAQFFGGFIVAFIYDWKLTLIMLSLSPFMVICGVFIAKLMASSTEKEAAQYAEAGQCAEEALTSVRTVYAFNGQEIECRRYNTALAKGKVNGIIKSMYTGIGLAMTFIVMFGSYCLAFWVGTNFVADQTMEPKTLLTVFFGIMMGSMALGQAGPQFAVIGTAQGAASAIYEIIDRNPEIDCYSEAGVKLNDTKGHITFQKVAFNYPSRPDVSILQGISFEAKPGETIALVGSSGCGKSTTVSLLLRYYNPLNGSSKNHPLDIKVTDEDSKSDEIDEADPKSDVKRLEKDLEKEGAKPRNLFAILKYARPEALLIFFAIIMAIIQGSVFPAFSLVFTQILNVFANTDMDKVRRDGHFWALMYLVLGFVMAFSLFFQTILFGTAAERLTSRIRRLLFRNILRQDVSYFDETSHSSGKLCTRLATDCPNVKSAIDYRLGSVFSAIVSVGAGIVIAFRFCWPMALLVCAIFPLGGVGQAFQMKYFQGKSGKEAKEMENAGKTAMEAIENIRTVQALTLEKRFYNTFEQYLEIPHQMSIRKSFVQGITYGFASSIFFFLYAAAFRFGVFLIIKHGKMPMDVLRTLYAISFTAGSMGFASAYFPEYMKAKLAAGLIFKMLETEPNVDNMSDSGIPADSIKGHVNLHHVQFAYPQRSDVQVLKSLSIEAKLGHTLALVGPSGCGKSTVVSLLERFYEPLGGAVQVDGRNISEYSLKGLRSQMALVSQEPILFDRSIRENIIYGLKENEYSEESIHKAATLANISGFISELPEQYETRVGEKGAQLSGGQKQRIAIARALIRNPKILLLDEATSALDTESEKVVQDALDRAREGRTCIVIAHRLATIVNADCIAVVNHGQIVEMGTHNELIEKRGTYFELTEKQNAKKQ